MKTKLMQLVYLSPVPWSSFAQRPHKFVEWFHSVTAAEVVWVDPYPTRFPVLSDMRRLGAKASNENSSNPSWMKIIRPCALPIEPLPWSGEVNALMWRKVLDEIDAFSHQQLTLLAIGKPSALSLAVMNRLPGVVSVYDAMDDFPLFYTGLSRLTMRCRETKLISRVTHVLASSTALKQRLAMVRSDVRLVHNGLDARVLATPKTSASLRTRKILGYVGTIGPWFDWEWVINLAKIQPRDVVRLIGPIFTPLPYTLPTNVEILPSCTHQNALGAMQGFDVGLIPFKKNALTASVDPIKYYEYRALGLPVLSTNFGEMTFRGNEEGTFLSYGIQDIEDLVQSALLYNADSELTRQFIINHTWEARFSAANIITIPV